MALSMANQWLLKPWMKPLLWVVGAVPALALLVGALTFIPSLALGPIVEQLMMLK